MSVVLRSSVDLIYLPDHGYVGIEGAQRILLQITSRIHRLDISHNLLGAEGTLQLVRGLQFCRSRFSSPEHGNQWGIREINLGCNAINDQALHSIMAYAKNDVFLRKVWVQANDIELRENLEAIVHCLNSTRIQALSLTNNKSLDPSSLSQLSRTLRTPFLNELHLSACNLGPDLCQDISTYLSSPRSRNLELLELNGNRLGANGVQAIVDAVEHSNFTIKHLGLLANTLTMSTVINEQGEIEELPKSNEEIQAEERLLSHQVHQRLPLLLERNRILTRRIRAASTRIIGPARILLNARPVSPEETARRVLANNPQPVFRLLDLPQEVIHHIVRHCSGDPGSLSEAQFARMRVEAEDRERLTKLIRVCDEKLRRAGSDEEEIIKAEMEVRDAWLRQGRWDRWELDKIPEAATETDAGHGAKA